MERSVPSAGTWGGRNPVTGQLRGKIKLPCAQGCQPGIIKLFFGKIGIFFQPFLTKMQQNMKKHPIFVYRAFFHGRWGIFSFQGVGNPACPSFVGFYFLKKPSGTHRASPVRPLPGAVYQGSDPFVNGGQAHWGEGKDHRRDIQGLKDEVDGTKMQTCQIANVQTF